MTRRAALNCRTMSSCATLRRPKWQRCPCLGCGIAGELTRPRPPPLFTLAHHSPSSARRVPQELLYGGKARRRRRCSYCSWKLRACRGSLLQPWFGSAQAAARLGEPSRVAACRAHAAAVVHGAGSAKHASVSCPLSVQSKCTGLLLPHLGRAPSRSGPFTVCKRAIIRHKDAKSKIEERWST